MMLLIFIAIYGVFEGWII